jgi:protein SCO1/2
MFRTYFLIPALLTAFLLAGCGGTDKDKDKTQEGKGKTYEVHGKVIAVDAEKKKVTLDHEDIPGLMKAMKMDFTVTDAKLLEGIKAGDGVQGKLLVKSEGDYVLTELKKH